MLYLINRGSITSGNSTVRAIFSMSDDGELTVYALDGSNWFDYFGRANSSFELHVDNAKDMGGNPLESFAANQSYTNNTATTSKKEFEAALKEFKEGDVEVLSRTYVFK